MSANLKTDIKVCKVACTEISMAVAINADVKVKCVIWRLKSKCWGQENNEAHNTQKTGKQRKLLNANSPWNCYGVSNEGNKVCGTCSIQDKKTTPSFFTKNRSVYRKRLSVRIILKRILESNLNIETWNGLNWLRVVQWRLMDADNFMTVCSMNFSRSTTRMYHACNTFCKKYLYNIPLNIFYADNAYSVTNI
jgi:hypothetical protein